jgi:hypothetical protein
MENCIRERIPLPEWITEAPELWAGLDLFYTAFIDLAPDRRDADSPVPWTAIQRYCEVHGLCGEQREDLFYHVREMDRVHLEWSAKKAKAALEASSKKHPVRRPQPRKR